MGFKKLISRLPKEPATWLALTIALAVACALLFSGGQHNVAATVCTLASTFCAYRVLHSISRMRSRINYLVNSALNGDFSYKFPVSNLPDQERDINITLNKLVTHIERLSADARQNERFLGLVINLVDIGIVVADEKGNVLQHNRAALDLLSLPVLTALCQFPADLSSLSIKKTQAVLHDQKLTIITLSDIRRPVQTAEVESWEKLTRVLTHEIMNSLTPITSMAQSLSRSAAATEQQEPLAVISASSQALMDFVKDFRKFTILPEPNPKVFYLKPFVDRVAQLASSMESASGIRFEVSVAPADAMAYTDESLLHQVMVNILKNAVEASPTRISVEARIRSDESVEISISNNGDLIPTEIASQIFTPFFTTRPAGSGIGLSLSRRIISRLGGTLTLSAHPSTRFSIII